LAEKRRVTIGVAKPLSISIETLNMGEIPDEKIISVIEDVFDLRLGAIIDEMELRKTIYKQTVAYGHFCRNDLDLPWERWNKTMDIKAAINRL